MRRRPGQAGACAPACWGLCSAPSQLRIGPGAPTHSPQRAAACPQGRHAPAPPKQSQSKPAAAAPSPRRRFYFNGGRGAAVPSPAGSSGQRHAICKAISSGPPAKGNAACGRDGHACERRSRVKCTALRAALDRRSPARQKGTRRRGPLGPVTDPPPTERSNP